MNSYSPGRCRRAVENSFDRDRKFELLKVPCTWIVFDPHRYQRAGIAGERIARSTLAVTMIAVSLSFLFFSILLEPYAQLPCRDGHGYSVDMNLPQMSLCTMLAKATTCQIDKFFFFGIITYISHNLAKRIVKRTWLNVRECKI